MSATLWKVAHLPRSTRKHVFDTLRHNRGVKVQSILTLGQVKDAYRQPLPPAGTNRSVEVRLSTSLALIDKTSMGSVEIGHSRTGETPSLRRVHEERNGRHETKWGLTNSEGVRRRAITRVNETACDASKI